ncbi:MAG: hypothetical protein ABF377_15270 [Akkermansiaceae bacterium]
MANDPLEDLLTNMPGDDASEEDIAEFMNQFMSTAGGEDMLKQFAGQITEGGALDQMLKEDEKKEELYKPPGSTVRLLILVELPNAPVDTWRRISLPNDAAFIDLHQAIQDSFGWEDSHFHEFQLREDGKVEITFSNDPAKRDEETDYCEVQNHVIDIYQSGVSEFHYLYGQWEHLVRIETMLPPADSATPDDLRPLLHDGLGHGPPEKCENLKGYAEFIKGTHPLCKDYEEDILEEFREGVPDLEKVSFRKPKI